MTEPNLYPCPALSARISERQCQYNRRAAEKGRPDRKVHRRAHHGKIDERNMVMLRPCLTCPGVRHLP